MVHRRHPMRIDALDLRVASKVYGRQMADYKISEAARLAGFTASALRFYETVGLLPEPVRTRAGYRSYDEAAVDRLRFVRRARQLGLPLEEIRQLVAIWDVGDCAPVQVGFATQISGRRELVAARIRELQQLHAQLSAAEQHVRDATVDELCGPDCACLATSNREIAALPLVCTLTTDELPDRIGAWRRLLAQADRRESIRGGERFVFPVTAGLAARVSELCAQEQQCCSFFTFRLELAVGQLTLDVTAPDAARHLVTELVEGQQ